MDFKYFNEFEEKPIEQLDGKKISDLKLQYVENEIKVSIIVPVYNVENYLNRCIDSIINQTYKNLEIILVDDGSTDNSGKICDEYKKIDSRIKVIHKTNGGLADARNAGLKIYTGDYVCFVDSDDYVVSNAIEEYTKKAVYNNSDVVVCGMERISIRYGVENKEIFIPQYGDCIIDESNIKEELWKPLYYGDEKKLTCMISACTKFIKAEFLNSHNLLFNPERKRSEDWEFSLELYARKPKIVFINLPLYVYFRDFSRKTLSFSIDRNAFKFLQKSDAFYKKYFDFVDFSSKQYSKMFCDSCFSFQLQASCSDMTKKEKQSFICEIRENECYRKHLKRLNSSLFAVKVKLFFFKRKKYFEMLIRRILKK